MAKVLQKHAGRAKERILQNLGKADRTTDEDFDLCVKNFNKQQAAVLRLQKEFKNYHQCLKAMQASQKSLMDTVCELYEPCWIGVDRFLVKAEDLNKSFDDFCEKINNQVLNPVGAYIVQFPEYSNKISKRNRKLLDYDNCRHNLQNLETMRKREEAKIVKAKEQLDDARSHFEVINTELHDELPALYDSRVSFFVSYLQCLYLAEAQFHSQASEMLIDINSILESLDEDSKKDPCYKLKNTIKESQANQREKGSGDAKTPPQTPLFMAEKECDGSSSGSASGSAAFSTPPTTADRNLRPNMTSDSKTVEVLFEDDKEKKADSDVPEIHPRFLYKVKGTYKYAAEDLDELSFSVGDVIDVISYEDPDEQEEGWLMGIFDGKTGLFPANFTSRI